VLGALGAQHPQAGREAADEAADQEEDGRPDRVAERADRDRAGDGPDDREEKGEAAGGEAAALPEGERDENASAASVAAKRRAKIAAKRTAATASARWGRSSSGLRRRNLKLDSLESITVWYLIGTSYTAANPCTSPCAER
jgi:hypothetical protein